MLRNTIQIITWASLWNHKLKETVKYPRNRDTTNQYHTLKTVFRCEKEKEEEGVDSIFLKKKKKSLPKIHVRKLPQYHKVTMQKLTTHMKIWLRSSTPRKRHDTYPQLKESKSAKNVNVTFGFQTFLRPNFFDFSTIFWAIQPNPNGFFTKSNNKMWNNEI